MKYVVFATLFLVGCGFTVTHEGLEDIEVGLGDLTHICPLCQPVCTGDTYSCTPFDGSSDVDCSECHVGCGLGRALMCEPDGPHCYNDAGEADEDPVQVFSFCMRDSE